MTKYELVSKLHSMFLPKGGGLHTNMEELKRLKHEEEMKKEKKEKERLEKIEKEKEKQKERERQQEEERLAKEKLKQEKEARDKLKKEREEEKVSCRILFSTEVAEIQGEEAPKSVAPPLAAQTP